MMKVIWSSIKNFYPSRGLVVLMLLFLVLVGTIAPIHQTYARECTPAEIAAGNKTVVGVLCVPPVKINPLDAVGSAISGGIFGDFVKGLATFTGSALLNIITLVMAGVMAIVTFIVSFFAVLLGIFMNNVITWVTSVPYTPINPAFVANPQNAITIGWGITRDLADMGLIFVLVAIAVTTILNIQEDWGKTLLKFVGIAILINFTPLIAGFIIDIANILTKLFFGHAQNGWTLFLPNNGDLTDVGTMFDRLGKLLNVITSGDPFGGVSILVQGLLALVFALASIAAFVTMIFLLVARVLALWLLVILSPLAFLMFILPKTKQYFTKWWENFWQWTFITIPLGFFFWLAATFKQKGDVICNLKDASNAPIANFDVLHTINSTYPKTSFDALATTLASGPLKDMCGSMMLLMAIGALFVGFFISFSFSATGSKMIVAKGAQWGTNLGTRVAYGAGRITGAGATAIGSRAGARYAASGFGKSAVGRGISATAGRIPQGMAFAGKKGMQYGLPLTKKGLEQMGKAGGGIGATGGAMAKGVYEPCPPGEHFDIKLRKCVPNAPTSSTAPTASTGSGAAATPSAGAAGSGGVMSLAQRAAQQKQPQAAPPIPAQQKPLPQAAQQQAQAPAQAKQAAQQVQQAPGKAGPSFPANGNNQDIILWLQQIARMQQGMGIAMNSWTTKDKADRQKLYDELAKDRNQFTYLAKRIPDIIDAASPKTLQQVYNVSSPQQARQEMHRSLGTQDFAPGGDAIPDQYVNTHSKEMIRDVGDAARLNEIDDSIRSNAQYSQRTKDKFTYDMFDHFVGNT